MNKQTVDTLIKKLHDHRNQLVANEIHLNNLITRLDDAEWYCPYCDEYLYGEEVTFEETHDPRCNGCGYPVQSEADPNEGAYDTLEEKYL